MSEKQSCAADIVYKQIDGGWHQYTVSLRPGQNYSWKDILADADSIAAADLSPIVNVQLMTAAGKAKELTAAYKNSGSRFPEIEELTAGEGKMFSIAGVSKLLDCPTIITWFNQLCVLGITTKELCGFGQIRRYVKTVARERFDEAAAQAHGFDDFVIETGMLKKYTGNGGSVIIPNGVTSIHDWAFWRCTHLTDVTLPDSVKSIDICAFEECKSLKSIGCGAFKDCESLTSITLPNSVASISDRVFSGCKNLKSITVPKRLEAAFSHYKSIEKISYTDSADNSL